MIRLVNGIDKAKHVFEIDQMFRLRKRTFHDRLGWNVTVKDGWEVDEFDDANPLYVLCLDDTDGSLIASLRLLPTTGPNMLCDVFTELLPPGLQIRSPTMWESSRFCVDYSRNNNRSANQIARATAELMCGVGEIGLAAGLTHIVTVTDLVLERIFRRMGCEGERLAEPRKFGKSDAVAIFWEVSEELLATMQKVAEISSSVLEHNIAIESEQDIPSRLRAASGITGSVLEHHRPDALVEAA